MASGKEHGQAISPPYAENNGEISTLPIDISNQLTDLASANTPLPIGPNAIQVTLANSRESGLSYSPTPETSFHATSPTKRKLGGELQVSKRLRKTIETADGDQTQESPLQQITIHSSDTLLKKHGKSTAEMVRVRDAGVGGARYIRTPMSELNETLQISPEDFLRLQPLCKQFMLDPEHPERFNMVGRKESPQVDVNKVRLFEATTKFLVEGGWGEEFWGEKNEIANRTYIWPESKEDIAHSMVGLMRRMVTNEKQRLYATAQREKRERGYKAASIKSKKPKVVDARSLLNKLKGIESSSEEQSMSPSPDAESFTQGSPPPSSRTLKPDEDLGQISRGQESIAASTLPSNTSIVSAPLIRATSVVSVQSTSPRFPDCWLNVLQSGRRILPKVPFNTDNGENFHDLLQFIDIIIDDGHSYKDVKVSGPTGVIDVNDEASWSAALEAIKDADWMDGEVRIMVDTAT